MPHDLRAFQLAGNSQHLGGVQLHHLSLVIFAKHREEVQQPLDVLFPVLRGPAGGGFADQVVGKLVVNDEGPRWVKIKEIGPFLPPGASVGAFVGTGVLGAKRRLHIRRRALHIAEHEDAAPFGNGHAYGKLPHGQRDGLFMGRNGRLDLVVRLLRLLLFAQLSVTGRQHNFILREQRLQLLVLPHELVQRLCRGDAVEIPHCVAELLSQLRRGEGVFLSGEQHEQEFLHVVPVQELPVVVGEEKLIQVKGGVHRLVFILQHDPAAELVVDHGPQLVGEHQKLWKVFIGIVGFSVPFLLCLLLVGIGPVENLLVGELLARKLLERRSREVQRMCALNVVESLVGLVGVHALLGLIHHQQIEGKPMLLLPELVNVLLRHPA